MLLKRKKDKPQPEGATPFEVGSVLFHFDLREREDILTIDKLGMALYHKNPHRLDEATVVDIVVPNYGDSQMGWADISRSKPRSVVVIARFDPTTLSEKDGGDLVFALDLKGGKVAYWYESKDAPGEFLFKRQDDFTRATMRPLVRKMVDMLQ